MLLCDLASSRVNSDHRKAHLKNPAVHNLLHSFGKPGTAAVHSLQHFRYELLCFVATNQIKTWLNIIV